MGSLENTINQYLNRMPGMKKVIKRIYQRGMYAISPKIKSEGNIVRVSPNDGKEYFFGYYDKSPWDASGRYMLCMQADDTWSDVSPKRAAKIILIDTEQGNKTKCIAETRTWNVQMGCMVQWLGPDFSSRIIYNDFRNGKYVSVILTVDSGEEKVVPFPVYTVALDGSFALSLDFSRLYRLRPGYGYYNMTEETKNEKLPNKPCIWKIILNNGEVIPLLKYTDFAAFEPREEMEDAEHKVNHIMLNPSGKRFMVLHRWFQGQRKYTRLVTCNVDGSEMYNLSDDDMVSHCFWKSDSEILAFENKKGTGSGYYLMKDKTKQYEQFWSDIDFDGHPSYSPDGNRVVFDRYPDRARIAAVMVSDVDNRDKEKVRTVARVFAPFKYDNDTRCDLHPRWSRDGKRICFDSVFEGHRGLYVVMDGAELKDKENLPLISVIIPVYNVEKYLERCVESVLNQTYQNIQIILVNDGSSDGSPALCERIAKEHPDKVSFISQANIGLAGARNSGLGVAKGEYVAFVDSDDWIAPDIYTKCIAEIQEHNCDIVDFKVVYTDGEKIPAQKEISQTITVTGQNILYDYLYRGQTETCPFSACRKLYKRELFNGVEFPTGKINEDIATNFRVLSNAKTLAHISDVGYYYYQNSESITNGQLRKRDFDLIDACKDMLNLANNTGNEKIIYLAKVKLARCYFSLLAKASFGGIADDIKDKDGCIKYLQKKLKKHYELLMKSPISKNRKAMIIAVNFNYKIFTRCVRFYKSIKKII